ncbi:hypothetical protein FOZ60_011497 [Perkinsus olseni]|uniref:Uncharacterized protein n=1 Tax=Perkinsus olseni TaxID=32597 RepID=A0A7J6PAR9_PEROL|nr:hypothetical protein FOZ60_011497 [Perkinsus olseni]
MEVLFFIRRSRCVGNTALLVNAQKNDGSQRPVYAQLDCLSLPRMTPFNVIATFYLLISTAVYATNESTCDSYCESVQPGSYCKYWQEPSVCFGTTLPCSCGGASTTAKPTETTTAAWTSPVTSTESGSTTGRQCDAFCDSKLSGSFCMTYKLPNVCHGTDIPCSC